MLCILLVEHCHSNSVNILTESHLFGWRLVVQHQPILRSEFIQLFLLGVSLQQLQDKLACYSIAYQTCGDQAVEVSQENEFYEVRVDVILCFAILIFYLVEFCGHFFQAACAQREVEST